MKCCLALLALVSVNAFGKATVTMKMVPEIPKVVLHDEVAFPGGPDEFVALSPFFTVEAKITNAGKRNVYLTGVTFTLPIAQGAESWYYGSVEPILVKPKASYSFGKLYVEALPTQSTTVYQMKVEVMGMENATHTEEVLLEGSLTTN